MNISLIENAVSLEPNITHGTCGETYHVQCEPGHAVYPSSPGTMFCDASGNWTNRPQCQINICDNSTYTITNGQLDIPSDSSPHGTYFAITCDPGYSANNPNGTMDCDENGIFTNKPTCNPNMCLNSSLVVQHGEVHFPTTQSPTETAYNITCNAGFTAANVTELTGTLQCESNGTWGNKPVCFMQWKSPSLSDPLLADITDGNPLTTLTLHKSNCFNFDLWLPFDLEVTSPIEVNITGTGIKCPSSLSVIPSIEITTGTDIQELHSECLPGINPLSDGATMTCSFTCTCSTAACHSLHVLIRRETLLVTSGQILDIVYLIV